MTKQEAIQQAYGKHWDIVSGLCDENGWIKDDKKGLRYFLVYEAFKEQMEIEVSSFSPKVRLKSLQGIENNNGWIKIESEADLPKTGEYDMSSFKLIYWTNNGLYYSEDYKRHKLHYESLEITHYQLIPIEKPKPPIY